MNSVQIADTFDRILTPTVVALGNFDGVHRGHQQVIRALETKVSGAEYLSVVSFNPHPQAFFSKQSRTLLTPIAEKAAVLEPLGVQQFVLLPFDQALAQLSPAEFVTEILVQRLRAQAISVGFNFGFGHRRAGTVEDLRQLAGQAGIEVMVATPQLYNQQRISSSAIRQALQTGDVALANRLLGHSYALVGEVVLGQQLGRKLGFPTANLALPPDKFLPQTGVYAVRVTCDTLALEQARLNPEERPNSKINGVLNLGYRPTISGQEPVLTVEAHLLNWSGDLYGHTLRVELEHYLRPEQRFPNLDALKAQIQQDCYQAETLLQGDVVYPKS
jgi:riboflavin kinase / FMN adenylyltransferase